MFQKGPAAAWNRMLEEFNTSMAFQGVSGLSKCPIGFPFTTVDPQLGG